MAKCPKCEKAVTYIKIQGMDAKAGFGASSWKALTYVCPSCDTILSVQIDPIAIKTDTVSELKRGR